MHTSYAQLYRFSLQISWSSYRIFILKVQLSLEYLRTIQWIDLKFLLSHIIVFGSHNYPFFGFILLLSVSFSLVIQWMPFSIFTSCFPQHFLYFCFSVLFLFTSTIRVQTLTSWLSFFLWSFIFGTPWCNWPCIFFSLSFFLCSFGCTSLLATLPFAWPEPQFSASPFLISSSSQVWLSSIVKIASCN